MRTRAWADMQAERAVFSSANIAKIYAATVSYVTAATGVKRLEMRGRKLSAPPCDKPLSVLKSALHSAPIVKTRNPFRLRIRVPRDGAQTEPGRVLRDHFQVFLISICIHCKRQLGPTILPVNSRFLRGEIVSASHPIGVFARTCGAIKSFPFSMSSWLRFA